VPTVTESELPRPLEGITVIDLTIALAGPFATQLLGALGATVIKVENPAGGDPARSNAPYVGPNGLHLERDDPADMSVSMLERGRNKLSITLDLKQDAAREVFGDLVRRADMVVENFSAGTADRLGVGYAAVTGLNPRIVYVSISGFGAGEPGKGMDTIFQALSGLMTTPGSYGDPPVRNGVPFGDLVGPLYAIIGAVAALLLRERTGVGQHVDVALLGALTSLVSTEPWDTMERAGIAMRTGNVVPRLAPFGIFPTLDGDVALCAPTDTFARGVFEALGAPELAEDERFSSRDRRVRHAAELHALISEWAAAHTSAEAIAALDARGVPTAPVRGTAAAVRDSRTLRRAETMQLAHPEFGPVDDLYGSGFPVRFSAARSGYESPPPWLGEHNDFVLGVLLGYPPERLDALRALGAI
jgi:crotonobetainyl-CoA:carnitine CoA-transferase CaiB-like acyl-CoA transferase